MLRPRDASRTTALFTFALALGIVGGACAGSIKSQTIDDSGVMVEEDDDTEEDASPPIFTDDALDAGIVPAPRARDGGADGARGGDAGTPRSGSPSAMCGAVARAEGHPPFAAIQKLATTNDEVRVLVYGQSISEQAWWTRTKAWLEATYPNAKLVMEEHARGGCASRCLIGHEAWPADDRQYNRLPEDVFAWRPDLIIFHVYGDDNDYRYIMRAFKEGCAAFDDYKTFDGQDIAQVKCTAEQRAMSAGYRPAEVLVQNDFPNRAAMLQPCPTNYQPGDHWECHMNEKVIPEQAAQHGYALQDNFHAWPKYIAENNVSLRTLVADDNTHLREPGGTDLMYEMTIPHLCY